MMSGAVPVAGPSREALTRSGLRTKLIVGFIAVSTIAALSGLGGLIFMDRVARTASVFSDNTSPLLSESIDLVRSAQAMRGAVKLSMERNSSAEESIEQLRRLEAEAQGHLETLKQQSRKAGTGLNLEVMTARQSEFVSSLVGTLRSAEQERAADNLRKSASKLVEETRLGLDFQLADMINRAEGQMARAEDEIKVQVQTGASTAVEIASAASAILTETYPVVQGAYKLTRESVRLRELVERYVSEQQSDDLPMLEQEIVSLFKTTLGIVRKVGSRLRNQAGKAEIADLRQKLELLQIEISGTEGLLSAHRQALRAAREIGEYRSTLERIEHEYFTTLETVEDAIRRLNAEAQQDIVEQIGRGRHLTLILVVVAGLASIALGVLFAHRIAGPLARLTSHLRRIRATGRMDTLQDPTLTLRTDEIGSLACSFDDMIAELEGARRALVDASAAEIRLQYDRLNAAVTNMPLGLCMVDSERALVICNSQFLELSDIDASRAVAGAPLTSIFERVRHDDLSREHQMFGREIARCISTATSSSQTVHHISDGLVVAATIQVLQNGGAVAILQDVTERHKAEARIAHMALHDALSGLPNRVMLREELTRCVKAAEEGSTPAVLCLDLDHFKAVNDTLGHPVGDDLLRSVADRLTNVVGEGGTVARLGGDEFAIVQPFGEQPSSASDLARRIVSAIAEPFDFDGQQVVIGASIGIAVAPIDGTDPDQLLRNADLALYRAKADGKGQYCFFEAGMDARAQERRNLELDLRKALALNEFSLAYQPLINLETSELTSFEALIRWHHPKRGIVPPVEFIPLAEELGLIGAIGAWVLKEACSAAMQWPKHVRVAVNLSPLQFSTGTLMLDVIAALGSSGLAANRLELEITESVLLKDTEKTLELLTQLRNLGARISMDDFGTGYSSLGYLQRFPFDKIKIDRSFVQELSSKPESKAIIRAVASLAASLGITTTAEGVESLEQLQRLKQEGCTEAQGYFFSRPKAAGELDAFIRERSVA